MIIFKWKAIFQIILRRNENHFLFFQQNERKFIFKNKYWIQIAIQLLSNFSIISQSSLSLIDSEMRSIFEFRIWIGF